MQGAIIGTKHTFINYGLMLAGPPVVSPPEPRENWVEIPGMHGALDMSKVQTGEMQYKMRTITMRFVYTGPREDWPAVYSEIMKDIHGKAEHITLDNDPAFYYDGIVKVEKYDPKIVHFDMAVTCKVQPFKYAYDGSEAGF